MKILQVHNFYKNWGGEDTVVMLEKKLLEENGHVVHTYFRRSDELPDSGILNKFKALKQAFYSTQTRREIGDILKSNDVDVCHFHNIYPLISTSLIDACHEQGIPVVMTLHNFRLRCLNGFFYRDDHICEDCLKGSFFNGIKHKCYRGSLLQSTTISTIYQYNWAKSTWANKVDGYICLSEFGKMKYIEMGLPEEKLYIKPNFVEKQERPDQAVNTQKDQYIFIGRLSQEKGISLILDLAKMLPQIKITVIGEGDYAGKLEHIPNIRYLGKCSREEIFAELNISKALLFPSLWYEGMPMTILEAFSQGIPVIGSRIGAVQNIITNRFNGFLFKPGSLEELSKLIEDFENNNTLTENLGKNAYQCFQNEFTPKQNMKLLLNIYTAIIEKKDS